MASLRILHTNDLHGKLTPELARRLASIPRDLYADSGDLVSSSNLGVPLSPDRAWRLLKEAGCDVGTLGNRETHLVEAAFRMKIEGCAHSLVCANLASRDGRRVLPPSVAWDRAGLRIGILGVMVPMITERMKSALVSQYLWTPPIPAALAEAQRLRPDVDLLIAVTHVGLSEDRELARAAPEIDLILGGHSHELLAEPERVGDTWICQGGSHARFVGLYTWDRGLVAAELMPLRTA